MIIDLRYVWCKLINYNFKQLKYSLYILQSSTLLCKTKVIIGLFIRVKAFTPPSNSHSVALPSL